MIMLVLGQVGTEGQHIGLISVVLEVYQQSKETPPRTERKIRMVLTLVCPEELIQI